MLVMTASTGRLLPPGDGILEILPDHGRGILEILPDHDVMNNPDWPNKTTPTAMTLRCFDDDF